MALAITWGGYADTDLDFSSFFNTDHTVAVRFMLQFPFAYTGPMLSVNGTGTYIIGQADFNSDGSGKTKLIVNAGGSQLLLPVDLAAGTWHHLAVVRSGSKLSLFVDGKAAGSPVSLPAVGLPSGKLRLGKDTFNATLDGGGHQFYGLLDDVAVFNKALGQTAIAKLASEHNLSGTEPDLLAGYTFGHVPPGGLPTKLSRPLTLVPGASIQAVSADRNNGADAAKLPLALTPMRHLPFPHGQKWFVIQGFDDPKGSHHGYASFCLDLDLAGEPQSDSNGKPFYAAAPGKVDFVKQDNVEGGAGSANFISVKEQTLQVCDYLHLTHNTSAVKKGDPIAFEQHLADVGDTGAAVGAFHLHIAMTNLGEGHKNDGGAFITIPAPYTNYDSSDDSGSTWHHVLRGIPRAGQWLRRATDGPERYTAVWRPSTAGEIQVYGWKYQDYRAKYDALWPQGWRLKLIDVDVVNGEARYNAVWQPSSEGEIQVYGYKYADYRAKYDELWKQGWRLKLLSIFVINGEPLYTAVWRPSTEGEIQVYGYKYADYRAKYDALWKEGWRLKLLNVYVVSGEPRYTAVWHPSTEGEIQVYGYKYADYRAKYDELWPQGWRLKLIQPYVQGGQVFYTAAWHPSTEGEIQVYGWAYDDYRAEYDVLWQKGWRLKLLEVYSA